MLHSMIQSQLLIRKSKKRAASVLHAYKWCMVAQITVLCFYAALGFSNGWSQPHFDQEVLPHEESKNTVNYLQVYVPPPPPHLAPDNPIRRLAKRCDHVARCVPPIEASADLIPNPEMANHWQHFLFDIKDIKEHVEQNIPFDMSLYAPHVEYHAEILSLTMHRDGDERGAQDMLDFAKEVMSRTLPLPPR